MIILESPSKGKKRAKGSLEINPDDFNKISSYKPSPFNKYSVPVHKFTIEEEDEDENKFLFP